MPVDPFSAGLGLGVTFGGASALLLRSAVIEGGRRLAQRFYPPPPVPPEPHTTVDDVAAAIERKLAGRFEAINLRVAAAERKFEAAISTARAASAPADPPKFVWQEDVCMRALADDLVSALVNMGKSRPAAEKAAVCAMNATAKPGVIFDEVFHYAMKSNGGSKTRLPVNEEGCKRK